MSKLPTSIIAPNLRTDMAEALAIIGGVAASLQLVQIARKALGASSNFPCQKSPKEKIRVWLIHSHAFSLIANELEKIFDNHNAVMTHLVQQCRQEANELAVLLLSFTRKLSPSRRSTTWFVWTHETRINAIFTNLRDDFAL
jgi:hypothetical protein